MIGPLEKKATVRIAGYLEKKGKMVCIKSVISLLSFMVSGDWYIYLLEIINIIFNMK